MAAAAILREHQQLYQPFPERIRHEQAFQLLDGDSVAPEAQLRLPPVLGRRQPHLREPGHLASGPTGGRGVGEWKLVPPQRERAPKGCDGGRRVAARQLSPPATQALLEPPGVDRIAGQGEHVARLPGHQGTRQAARVERLPDAGDVTVQ
ncbi:MAG TPA: hypothetical protein VFR67_04905 [Pilimelia sp.]|nr:hypothetical protein [Pilimelia sp.]